MADDYLIVPDTGEKITDGTVVVLYRLPNMRWIVHHGDYSYNGHKESGCYVSSIPSQTNMTLYITDLCMIRIIDRSCIPVPCPPIPPCPPPPYFPPKPSKVDEKLRKLQKDVERLKTVEALITAFEQKNEPAILTIGADSYQFGTDRITNSEKEVVDGMYANVICSNTPVVPDGNNFVIDRENYSVYANEPVDLLQTERTRLALEINVITEAITAEGEEPVSLPAEQL